jgi:hypothetical protein
MGAPVATWYGGDVGSAIEDVEKIVGKIKTNKYDKKDIYNLYSANLELIKALLDENEN